MLRAKRLMDSTMTVPCVSEQNVDGVQRKSAAKSPAGGAIPAQNICGQIFAGQESMFSGSHKRCGCIAQAAIGDTKYPEPLQDPCGRPLWIRHLLGPLRIKDCQIAQYALNHHVPPVGQNSRAVGVLAL